jgi:hypothetical protein
VIAMRHKNKNGLSVLREPSGRRARAGREPDVTPAQVKRLRDAALAGLQREEWGSELGRLLLTRKIEAEHYAAGRRWSQAAARYRAALCAPLPHPPAISFESGGSRATPPDPASPEGERLAARDGATVRELREAEAALREAGPLAERVVRGVCERDEAPGGMRELEALNRGLAALVRFWRMGIVRAP